jgi:membrane-associated phospholipid phosphatase
LAASQTLTFFRSVTDLGDSALLVPASLLLLAYLLYLGKRRLALVWMATVALCASLTLMVKIAFPVLGADLPFPDMLHPSGHASFGTTFYLCAALMLAGDREGWRRTAILVAAVVLAAAIAISRVIVQAHSVSEVIFGLAIGSVCVGWFSLRYFAGQKPRLGWEPLLGMLLALAVVTHGWHLDLEGLVRHLSTMV